MNNKNLKKFYDCVYSTGEHKHYSKNLLGKGIPLQVSEVLKEISWKGKSVLDIGCGTGLFSYLVKQSGANRVVAVDYSKEAIIKAKEKYGNCGIEFYCRDFKKMNDKFDVVTALGFLEHTASPFRVLKKLKSLLNPGGSLIIVCPNWANIRGYVLLTLFYLFEAPITLADRHYLTPLEFKDWVHKLRMNLSFRTFDHSWGGGNKMIRDFKRRLPRVLPGNKNIDKFISWLEKHNSSIKDCIGQDGAVALYHFQ